MARQGTGPILIDAEVGKPVVLDASQSRDPDGQRLHYHWFHYAEAGSTGANLAVSHHRRRRHGQGHCDAHRGLPSALAAGGAACPGTGTAHIILAVTDDGSPRLTSYRRIILNVRTAAGQ